jgi:hypothetical protein
MERQPVIDGYLMDGVHPTPQGALNYIALLNKWYTKQLLNRLRDIRANISVVNGHWGDPTPEEAAAAEVEANAIKAILATREHVPGKIEAKQIRQYKQHRKQTR